MHGAGFSEVFEGAKRWFLLPPEHPPHAHPNQTVADWASKVLPELYSGTMGAGVSWGGGENEGENEGGSEGTGKAPGPSRSAVPLECTIRPGELIYFPPEWHHATLNYGGYVNFASVFIIEE